MTSMYEEYQLEFFKLWTRNELEFWFGKEFFDTIDILHVSVPTSHLVNA
mgnify:CR=1 FL=1